MTEAGAPLSRYQRTMVMVVVTMATAMSALDITIAGVALPHMRGTFSATQDQISWVLTSYIVATAVVLPCTGWLAARFGRKRLFIVSLIGFTLTSMLCGSAATLNQEVLFRAMQGVFGAPLVPISQSIILDTFRRDQHAKVLALWGFGIMLGPVLGPTIGGYLTEEYSWPWIYYINLPLGLLTLVGAITFIHKTPIDRKARLDWLGFVALGIGVAALQVMLDRGESEDWFSSTEIIIEAMLAFVGIYVFVVHIVTGRNTFLNTELLRDRNFAVGLVLVFAFGFILLPPIMLLPALLQDLSDYPVYFVGLVLSPRGLGVMVGMLLVGQMANRIDPRWIMFLGLALVAVGGWPMLQWNLNVGPWELITTGIVQGAGMGFFYVPLLALTFSTLPARFRNEGTGFFQLMRNVGSSVSVSVFVLLLSRNTTINRASLIEHINPYNPALGVPQIAEFWDRNQAAGLAALDAEITRQAAMIAYINDFYLVILVAIASMPLLLLLRPPGPEADEAAAPQPAET